MLKIILINVGTVFGVHIAVLILIWLIGEKGPVVRKSTKAFVKISGWKRVLRPRAFFHGYIYLRFLKQYVGIGLKFLKIPFLGPAGVRWIAGKSYHGKTMTNEQAKALISIDRDIPLVDLGERVIPFPIAREIVLNASPEIAVMECPCRGSRPNPCKPTQVCMAIGQPFVDFVIEHNPKTSRRLTQQEAVALLQEEHDRGHIHTAWFKDALADRFYAICNCCGCCCAGLELMKKNIDLVIPSGYIAHVKEELCNLCMKCMKYCIFDALAARHDSAELVWDKCKGCGVCVDICPQHAISLVRDEKKGDPLDIKALLRR